MWVYGDRSRRLDVRQALAQVAAGGDYILAAGLAQGLVDAEFETRGRDDLTPLHAAALRMVRGCLRGTPEVGPLLTLCLPDTVAAKEAEGHAFYAVYPEAYARAARSVGWPSPPLVIGVRSIGLGLAAAVAEATGADVVFTVRPVGPPFQRELRLSEALGAVIARHPGPVAIVDEGPGLSGSSFGAVLDALDGLGVGLDRIVMFPSHAGEPGPRASARARARWKEVRRCVADWRPDPAELFADLTGAVLAREDLSGGNWRKGRPLPAFPQQERLKVRLASETGAWIARFAGLGPSGAGKFERAKALHAAGFGAEPIALRNGWLLSRWVEGGFARPRLDRLANYLAFRARAFPGDPGAGLEALAEMVRTNARELALAIDPPLSRKKVRPVHVDGRLHAWEWLQTDDGRVLKTDALDHSCSHDLIGCQDIGWDIAGAAVELDLPEEDVERLRRAVGADPELTAFYRLAYPAFQAGLWTYAGEPAQVERYRRALETAWRAAGCGARRRAMPEQPDVDPADEVNPGTAQSGEHVCPRCQGVGRVDGAPCEACGGSGKITALVGDA